jgi:hypothetical protein
MPKYSSCVAAVQKYRKRHGRNADSAIRAQNTGVLDIDRASPEMLESAMANQSNSSTPIYCKSDKRPKSIAELDHAAIWRRYNSAAAGNT